MGEGVLPRSLIDGGQCRLSDVHQRLQWGGPAVMAIGDARG